jgi:hypothetical protein
MREWRKAWGDEATYRNLIESFIKANKLAWAVYVRDMLIETDANAPLPASRPGRWIMVIK